MTRQHRTPRAALALLLATSCFSRPDPAPPPRPAPAPQAHPGVALDRLPLAVVELPADVRDGRAPSDRVPLSGWEPVPDTADPTFEAPSPIRPRATFFSRAPRGTRLQDPAGRALPWAAPSLRRWWRLEGGRIRVQLPDGSQALAGLHLTSVTASAREARLNPSFAGLDPDAFVRARLQLDAVTREGLLLPAPATVAVDVEVPPAGELHLTPILLPPELLDLPPGDGAEVRVSVEVDGQENEIWRTSLDTPGVRPQAHLDLSRWTGRRIRLHLRTAPGASSRYDYVFLADPVVASRTRAPRRTVVVFVDTLRADHLPTYGYERATAPWLDRVAREGAVFERALSVAPWTLPAWRSLWTGRRPPDFAAGPTLGDALRERGVATALIGANLYLADAFSGARGFGHHHVEHLAPADEQVDAALAWLSEHSDRDGLLMLHLMDPHLPYREPEAYRGRFAGPAPSDWAHGDDFLRRAVYRTSPEVRAWITDRYDNNVAWVDAELSRLDAVLRPDDLLIVLSDHGEEFWDHGGFEHGHTLHEELVHVPLIVRGPGILPARHRDPVSLLDVAPTIASHHGASLPDVAGVDLMTRLAGAPPAPAERLLPLGHPLYGFERWGVTDGQVTYETHAGQEHLRRAFGTDTPAPLDPADWHPHLSRAHGRPAVKALRVGLRTTRPRGLTREVTLTLQVSEPDLSAWLGEDAATPVAPSLTTTGDTVSLTLPRGWRGARDLYLYPPPDRTVLSAVSGRTRLGPLPLPDTPFPGSTTFLEQPLGDEAALTVTSSVTLRPAPDATPTSGFDPELRGMLERAGYLQGE